MINKNVNTPFFSKRKMDTQNDNMNYSDNKNQNDYNSPYLSKEEILKEKLIRLEEENRKLKQANGNSNKEYEFRENLLKARENFPDFTRYESKILEIIDTSVLEVGGMEVKYFYESGYEGIVAAYNMAKLSLGEMSDFDEYIEKNLDVIANNENVKNIVIEQYLKELDSSKYPSIIKNNDGYTSYTRQPKPKTLEEAKKLYVKSLE